MAEQLLSSGVANKIQQAINFLFLSGCYFQFTSTTVYRLQRNQVQRIGNDFYHCQLGRDGIHYYAVLLAGITILFRVYIFLIC